MLFCENLSFEVAVSVSLDVFYLTDPANLVFVLLFVFQLMNSGGNHCILFVILSVLIFASKDWKVIAEP